MVLAGLLSLHAANVVHASSPGPLPPTGTGSFTFTPATGSAWTYADPADQTITVTAPLVNAGAFVRFDDSLDGSTWTYMGTSSVTVGPSGISASISYTLPIGHSSASNLVEVSAEYTTGPPPAGIVDSASQSIAGYTITPQVVAAAVTGSQLSGTIGSPEYGDEFSLTASLSIAGAFPSGDTLSFHTSSGLVVGSAPAAANATIDTEAIPGGSQVVTVALLNGSAADPDYQLNVSPQFSTTIARASSHVDVTCASCSGIVGGQRVTITATASRAAPVVSGAGIFPPAAPVGSTSFFANARSIGTSLGSSPFTLNTSLPAGNPDALTADYLGDGNYLQQASSETDVVVTLGSTTTIASASPNPGSVGANVTLSATVKPVAPSTATPTGSVEFFVDGSATPVATTTLAFNGTASASTSGLTAGTHSIVATYQGSSYYSSSSSSPYSETVTGLATVISVSVASPSTYGQGPSFGVAVSPGSGGGSGATQAPTGSLQVSVDGSAYMTVPLTPPASGNIASAGFTASPALHGGHPVVTITYPGDSTYGPATWSQTLTVTPASETTSLSLSGSNVAYGTAVTATATLNSSVSGSFDGSVTFSDNGQPLATVAVAPGSHSVAYTWTPPAGAGQTITASYGGGSNYTQSGSPGSVTLTVAAAPTSTTLASSQNPSVAGHPVTYTATVTPAGGATGTPAGTVRFLVNGSLAAQPALNGSGKATWTDPSPSDGDSIEADFVPTDSTQWQPSSGSLTQTVDNVQTTTTVSSPANNASYSYGSTITFTATVSPVPPSGTVTFSAGGVDSPPMPVDATTGVATWTTDQIPASASPDTLTASYSGTTNYAPSSNSSVHFTVTPAAVSVCLTVRNDSAGCNPTPTAASWTYGQPADLTISLARQTAGGGGLSGEVDIYQKVGTALAGPLASISVASSNGSLSFDWSIPTVDQTGTLDLVAVYTGATGDPSTADTNDSPATSPTLDGSVAAEQLSEQGTGLSVAVPGGGNPVNGQTVTLAVTLGPADGTTCTSADPASGADPCGPAGGTVTFSDSFGNSSGPVTLVADNDGTGDATATTSFLVNGSGGSDTFYVGDFVQSAADPANAYAAPAPVRSGLPTGDFDAVGPLTVDSAQLSVTPGGGPATYDAPVAITATVEHPAGTPVPTGTVTFTLSNSTTVLGSTALDGSGTATITPALTANPTDIDMTYQPDAGSPYTQGATYSDYPVSVDPVTPSIAVAWSTGANPVQGQSAALVAGVDPSPSQASPGGSITFTVDGGAPDGPYAVTSNGSGGWSATSGPATQSAGTHSVQACYTPADSTQFSAACNTFNLTVDAAPTSTALTVSSPAISYGAAETLTAAVTATAPGAGSITGGSVAFTATNQTTGFTQALGTVVIDATTGTATLITGEIPGGNELITAAFSGQTSGSTTTFAASQGTATVTVAQDATTTALTLGSGVATSSYFGQPVAVSVTVSAAASGAGCAPSGLVLVHDTTVNSDIGYVVLPNNVCPGSSRTGLTTVAFQSVGVHSLIAEYIGDGNYLASDSTPQSWTVNAAPTAVTVSSNMPASPVSGQPINFTATVEDAGSCCDWTSTQPRGTVTATDSDTGLIYTLTGPASSSSNRWKLSGATFTAGQHDLTFAYGGDANYAASNSAVDSFVVAKAQTAVTISSSSNPSNYPATVNITASVAPSAPGAGTPTGTLTITQGGTTVTCTLPSNSACKLVFHPASAGTFTISANYAGDDNFFSSHADFTQSVGQATPAVSLIASANPSVTGQPVTYTATVSAVSGGAQPTGSVTFSVDGSAQCSSVTLNTSGSATCTDTYDSAAGSSHAVHVAYSGDVDYVEASADLSQSVNRAPSTTSTAVAPPSTVHGQPVTITVTVAAAAPGAGTPTGTVSITDTSTSPAAVLGTPSLSGGTASITVSSLSVGTHSISTTYSGDASFNASSTPAPSSVTVSKASTTTALTVTAAGPHPVTGETPTLTATVSVVAPGAGTPTSTVAFSADGAPLPGCSAVSLSAGTTPGTATASCTSWTPTAAGSHTLTAVYAGDAGDLGSSTSPSATVDRAATTTAVTSSPNPSLYGQTVTISATVGSSAPGTGTPTGSVAFTDVTTGLSLGTATLSAGSASITKSFTVLGDHTIRAAYAGDVNYLASTQSTAAPQDVQVAGAAGTLSVDNPAPTYGQAVTFSVTINALAPASGSPTGTVSFVDADTGNAVVGTAPVGSTGLATLTTTALAPGAHDVIAEYSGDADFTSANSNDVTLSTSQDATSTTLAVSPNPATWGQGATYRAVVSATAPGSGTPTGTVTFYVDGNPAGQGTLSGGTATLTDQPAVGGHSVSAAYSGDADYLASNSAGQALSVNRAPTATSLALSANHVTFGTAVQMASVVSGGGGTPTGTVSFWSGGSLLAQQTMGGGSAAASVSLPAGVYSVVAVYSGDGNHSASQSAAGLLAVGVAPTSTTLTATPNQLQSNATLSVEVAVTSPVSGVPAGTVQVLDGGSVVGTITLGSDATGFTAIHGLTVGQHPLTAQYLGDPDFDVSASAPQPVTVIAEGAGGLLGPGSGTGGTLALPAAIDPVPVDAHASAATFDHQHLGPVGVFDALAAIGLGDPLGILPWLLGMDAFLILGFVRLRRSWRRVDQPAGPSAADEG